MPKRNFINHIVRGCGYLPGVGEHPGTGFIVFLILLGGVACIKAGGFTGFMFGSGLMAITMLPFHFYGAYERSKTSDQLLANENSQNQG